MAVRRGYGIRRIRLDLLNIEDTNSPTGMCRNTKREIAAALTDGCTTIINMPVLVANVHIL